MNPTPPSPGWSELVGAARRDLPPPVNFDALLRAAHREASAPAGLLEEFVALFATRRALLACGLAAAAALTLAVWQGVAIWDQVSPLADLLPGALGGLS